MIIHTRILLYESLIRAAYICGGLFVKWIYLPPQFSYRTDEEYMFPITDIPFFSDKSEYFTILFSLLGLIFAYLLKTYVQNKKAYQSFYTYIRYCFAPAIIFNLYFIAIHFYLRPWVRKEWSGFTLSGHAFRKAVANGIFLRICFWVIAYRQSMSNKIFWGTIGLLCAMIAFGWYENFCTGVFFHSTVECVVGYIFGLVTIFFL